MNPKTALVASLVLALAPFAVAIFAALWVSRWLDKARSKRPDIYIPFSPKTPTLDSSMWLRELRKREGWKGVRS